MNTSAKASKFLSDHGKQLLATAVCITRYSCASKLVMLPSAAQGDWKTSLLRRRVSQYLHNVGNGFGYVRGLRMLQPGNSRMIRYIPGLTAAAASTAKAHSKTWKPKQPPEGAASPFPAPRIFWDKQRGLNRLSVILRKRLSAQLHRLQATFP